MTHKPYNLLVGSLAHLGHDFREWYWKGITYLDKAFLVTALEELGNETNQNIM